MQPEPALVVGPTDAAPIETSATAAPRSRRSILAAAAGGLAATVAAALGRPSPTEAAAGDSLKVGLQNFAGTAATRLSATSSGGAFWMTQNGSGSAIRGDSTSGHGGVFNTSHADRFGLNVANLGGGGTGAAIRGDGGVNDGVVGSSTAFLKSGVHGSNSGVGIGVLGEATNVTEGIGVRGTAVNGVGVQGIATTGYAGSFSGNVFLDGHIDFDQSTTPSPATGRVRLFARASGGHIQLVALFQDGHEVVLGASLDPDT